MTGSITVSDWTGIGLVIFAAPSAVLAWNSISDRRHRREQHQEQRAQSEMIEMIGRAFFGPDPSMWPKPAKGCAPMAEQIERVSEQLKPSNGKTVAKQIEEANHEIARVAVLMGEHMSDGHGGQVWPVGR